MATRATVYDDLLSYLEGILFQIPVMSFIDRHCMIFDPSTEECEQYRKIWNSYKDLVSQLIDCFRQDCGLSRDQVIKAVSEMDKETNLHAIYKEMFQLIAAIEDFRMFVTLMTQKNIELQQQVLVLIMSQTGSVPNIMQDEYVSKQNEEKKEDNEADILARALKASKEEYDALRSREAQQESELEKAVALSQQEALNLEKQKYELELQMEQEIKEMQLSDSKITDQKLPVLHHTPAVPKQSSTTPVVHPSPKPVDDKAKSSKPVKHLPGESVINPALCYEFKDKREHPPPEPAVKPKHPEPAPVDKNAKIENNPDMKLNEEHLLQPALAYKKSDKIVKDDDSENEIVSVPEYEAPDVLLEKRRKEKADRKIDYVRPPTGAKETPTTKDASGAAAASTPAASLPAISSRQTNQDAAKMWLQSALSEAENAETGTSAETSSSEEELKKRQAFLNEQRDKLIAMKQKEREKQLASATKSQPSRPQSARAARSALKEESPAPANTIDPQQLAMRKAIAERVKKEVIGKAET